jgi:hypothetical protein
VRESKLGAFDDAVEGPYFVKKRRLSRAFNDASHLLIRKGEFIQLVRKTRSLQGRDESMEW